MSKKIGKRYFRQLVKDACKAISLVHTQVIIATDCDRCIYEPLEDFEKYIMSLEQKIFNKGKTDELSESR